MDQKKPSCLPVGDPAHLSPDGPPDDVVWMFDSWDAEAKKRDTELTKMCRRVEDSIELFNSSKKFQEIDTRFDEFFSHLHRCDELLGSLHKKTKKAETQVNACMDTVRDLSAREQELSNRFPKARGSVTLADGSCAPHSDTGSKMKWRMGPFAFRSHT